MNWAGILALRFATNAMRAATWIARSRPGRPLTTNTRGFNVRLWQAGGLGYALVSDVDGAELAQLAARLGG